MANFPEKAKVVIVGQGGIVGASVAHHLIERGWDDIVGLDMSAIPTDVGSTSHASDFCYATAHDQLTCATTMYSIDFFHKRGNYEKVGGLEVARVGDDDRMAELKRKVASGKAFGTNAHMISAKEAKEKFPLLEEDMIQGALWDPDAGLVVPRSQSVAGDLVNEAVATGKLQAFANTEVTDLIIEDGHIKGVVTPKGKIMADYVVVCAGLWGRTVAKMAGEDLPVMPVDHPLLWFGPYDEFDGTGKEIGYPLLRDQGNSAYMRDTGDKATGEGGMICLNLPDGFDAEEERKIVKYLSLNGQTKTALEKSTVGGWRYDIVDQGFKANMPDLCAAVGLAQIRQYESKMLPERQRIFEGYNSAFADHDWAILPSMSDEVSQSSLHLYQLRIDGIDEEKRNAMMRSIAESGVGVNVHYVPMPMLTLFKDRGFDISDFPNAFRLYQNEITLPVYNGLTEESVQIVAESVIDAYSA